MEYDPKIWNINAFTRDNDLLINLTNNPVKNYNRHLNAQFYLLILLYLAEALQKGRNYVEYLSDLTWKKAYKPKPLQAVVIPPIPKSYLDFSGPEVKASRK